MLKVNGFELDDFTAAYLECALWSSYDTPPTGKHEEPLDTNFSISDIAPSSMELIVADCKKFQEINRAYFNGNYSQAGHDYWLTRNRHGTGFWDRDDDTYDKFQRDRLTDAAHRGGEASLYIGDDGKIYFS